MRREGTKLIAEQKQCYHCKGAGEHPERVKLTCRTCGGTGRGKRGAARQCKGRCLGDGDYWGDGERVVTCGSCEGTGRVAEGITDRVPAEIMAGIPLRVIRQGREVSWNEANLGMGCLWSCTDYGRAWERPDAELLQRVRKDLAKPGQVQACKVARKTAVGGTWELAAEVLVVLSRGGYSLRARFTGDGNAAEEHARRELGVDAGRAVGMLVCERGGNGTLAAALWEA